ncbi:MAG: hypothetical protein LC772_05945 [Chloroflexi bacterium]|nr:hypothetical protein [Chloroflexota bacterium]
MKLRKPPALPKEKPSAPIHPDDIRGAMTGRKLIREGSYGWVYLYLPVYGRYIVAAQWVCGQRLTLKNTRIEVGTVLKRLAEPRNSFEQVNISFGGGMSPDAIRECSEIGALNEFEVFERPVILPAEENK